MPFLYLFIAFIFNALANIFLKLKAEQGLLASGFSALFFAANFLFYYLALRSVPLSTAYPIMVGASFLIINSYAYFFLSEKINLLQILGYMLIVSGIIVVFYFTKNN